MSLSHYYGRAKSGLMGISPKEATEHGEKLLIAGATGALLGLTSAGMGGLDHKLFGFNVPVDGLASLVLSIGGLTMNSPELCTASVAAAGSASTRSFEALFKKTFAAHGDFDSSDIPFGADPELGFGGHHTLEQGQFAGQFGIGFGAERDRLLDAAASL